LDVSCVIKEEEEEEEEEEERMVQGQNDQKQLTR
jgi:hypothetical protein